jgi:hypothetical protein
VVRLSILSEHPRSVYCPGSSSLSILSSLDLSNFMDGLSTMLLHLTLDRVQGVLMLSKELGLSVYLSVCLSYTVTWRDNVT